MGKGSKSCKRDCIRRLCAYCGDLADRKNMISVPKNEAKRNKCVERLGQQFGNNIKKINQPYVCSKHFPHISQNAQQVQSLPISNDVQLRSIISSANTISNCSTDVKPTENLGDGNDFSIENSDVLDIEGLADYDDPNPVLYIFSAHETHVARSNLAAMDWNMKQKQRRDGNREVVGTKKSYSKTKKELVLKNKRQPTDYSWRKLILKTAREWIPGEQPGFFFVQFFDTEKEEVDVGNCSEDEVDVNSEDERDPDKLADTLDKASEDSDNE